jgi:transposase
MEVVHDHCAGLDVHKDIVVARTRIASRGRVSTDHQRFATTTRGLMELAEWLEAQGCTHVAMEATGVYWKPVWHVLEGTFELILANASEVRNVPGRKSDMNDAAWIAELLAHGLIRASFVPPEPIQQLRDLTRTRKQLVRQVAQHTLRIQKTLEDANLKLSSVVSDVLGVSGRAILEALIAGEDDPERLLAKTTGRLKAPRQRLLDALQGRITSHHRFLLRLHLDQIAGLEHGIATLETEIGRMLEPFRDLHQLLISAPGINHRVAAVILGEVGIDMTRFPSPGHLVSWVGLCPRMDESAGKYGSTRLRHGAPWLKTTLVQAAWAAVRCRDSYLRAQFLRLRARRGPQKAIVAVTASLLTAVYHMLRDGVEYRDLGSDYFDRREKEHVLRRLTRRIEDLGYRVVPAA